MDVHMNENRNYTLAELAAETGLTERTVRYYIEQVLPPHHKQGRGKLARYGTDTLNCLRFILLVGERYGFKPGQAKGVLAGIGQDTVDRVVSGEEELAVMTVPMQPASIKIQRADSLPRSSMRMQKYKMGENHNQKKNRPRLDLHNLPLKDEMFRPDRESAPTIPPAYSITGPMDSWRTIFVDNEVRIQCRGQRKLSAHQREQIEAAARLIGLALK
jgi:DNA-binding transcriptional MerR regulator